MTKILITSRSFGSGKVDHRGRLVDAGYCVVNGPADHDLAVMGMDLAEVSAWIAGVGPITAGHLDHAPKLRVVARYGVGVDAVDLTAARTRGVVVTNTPGANSGAVADHTMALLLGATRRIVEGDRRVRRGEWKALRGRDIGGMTIGIWGFGRVGQAFARRLAGFGARILVCDPYLDPEQIAESGVESCSPAELATSCDAVSLNAPGGATLVTREWLHEVRPGLILVNTARADLVDEPALAAALRTGAIASYAADTLSAESADATSPLLSDDLAAVVTLTPHTASQTDEAIDEMGRMAVESVLSVLHGQQPPTRVN